MRKEPKFKTYDEFLEFIQSGKTIRNLYNFKFFSREKISDKLYLGRYLILRDSEDNLYIKYCTVKPDEEIVSYANVIHEKHKIFNRSESVDD